ncbi:hypothetical protein Tco_1471597, partial [Tanacetum coccineum]
FLEELLSNDSPLLPENESFHFDVPSSLRPPAKPPDVGIYFEPDTGFLTTKVGVENRYMVTLVDGVLASGVVMIFEIDIAFYATPNSFDNPLDFSYPPPQP